MRALRTAPISAATFAQALARFRRSATFAVLASTLASTGGTTLACDAARSQRSAPATAAASLRTSSAVVASVGRRASHNHRYHAEVVATTPIAAGVRQSWTVLLTRRGHRRVSDARLTVRSWSPETGEVSEVTPRARYVGGSRYRIDDIYFARTGWWNVALVIDAANGSDSVAFNVVLPTRTALGRPR